MPVSPTIEETILSSFRPGIAPHQLVREVRSVHPEATKKEIIVAAFAAVIALAEDDPDRARAIQDFALRSRGE